MSDPAWQAIVDAVVEALATPALALVRPDSFIYWPYLVSAAVIALFVYVFSRPLRRFSLSRLLDSALSRDIWLCKSTVTDFRFYFVGGVGFSLVVVPLGVSGVVVALAISDGLEAAFGPAGLPAPDPLWVTAAYTVLVFLAADLGHYIAHYLAHRTPVLWEFHKAHHSAQVLTPLTNNRFHPVDLYVLGSGQNLFAGIASGVAIYAAGGELPIFTVMGVHAGLVGFRLWGTLKHSQVWLSFGWLDRILVSPAIHQIHHSVRPEHHHCNYGLALSIWDWAFGTLWAPQRRLELRYGLGDGSEPEWHGVWKIYVKPFVGLARRLYRRPANG